MQQPSPQPPPQPSVVVLPQQRSSLSGSTTNTSPSPAQSPYSNLQSPVSQQNAAMLNQHLVQHLGSNSVAPTRSPAPGGIQPVGTITSGGALTPAPSPSPQTRTAASPVIRSTTPQPTVIHQVWLYHRTLLREKLFPLEATMEVRCNDYGLNRSCRFRFKETNSKQSAFIQGFAMTFCCLTVAH
jgi:hypothetical protein